MRFIKLTGATSDKAIYVNIKHIITFFEYNSETTKCILSDEGKFATVKETPEEIVRLIKNAEEV